MIIIDVKEHIENEILDLQENGKCDIDKDYLRKLENLTDKDIRKIDNKLEMDDDLRKFIDETVNYYIYHLIEDKYREKKGNN